MNRSTALCIIPCGSRKIWSHAPHLGGVAAEQAYISTYHRLCKQYAGLFFDHWVILSAKHGFLRPDDPVDGPYDVAFNRPGDKVIGTEALREQIVSKKLDTFDTIVLLAGRKYRKPVTEAFGVGPSILFPFERYKGIGYIQQALKAAVLNREPLH